MYRNMKKIYVKPSMEIVKIAKSQIICNSPGGYGSQSVPIPDGGGKITEDINIW